MPRVPSVPAYRHHKARNLAVVTIRQADGMRRAIYLGKLNSAESRAEYARIVAELAVHPLPPPQGAARPNGLTVAELLAAFKGHAESHYRRSDGTVTGEVREYGAASRLLRELYGHTPGAEFGPLKLKAVREAMIQAGWCRGVINKRVDRVKRLFKWAASEEMVPVAVFESLRTVAGLREGRSPAREAEPVRPVEPAAVDATLSFLNRHVRAMVELQRLTGMRPGEVCRMRLADIDRSGPVWVYRPVQHKTRHHGKSRVVMIGPKGQKVILGFLAGGLVEPEAPLFSPLRAREERYAVMREMRRSKVPPSQTNRRAAKPKRQPATSYSPHSYAHAVEDACSRAFPPPPALAKRADETAKQWRDRLTADERTEVKAWRRRHHWHPNQLRHAYASEVRKEHGLEAAQVLLGHSRADVTQVYAERNESLAAAVAAKIG